MVAPVRQRLWKWAARSALALALGLVTTFAVAAWAWHSTAAGQTTMPRSSQSDTHARCEVVVMRGAMRTSATAAWWADGPEADSSNNVRERAVAILPHREWQEACREQFNGANTSAMFSMSSYGWPMRCLSGWSYRNSLSGKAFIGAGWWQPGWMKSQPGLPVFVLWRGLAVDVLVFAAVWWWLLLVPGTLRRLTRSSAGRCVECGYDLRGLPTETCPECGSRSKATESALIDHAVPRDRPG